MSNMVYAKPSQVKNAIRNSMGQWISVGDAVVMVSQGQGYTNLNIGKVIKITPKGTVTLKYWDGSTSNAILRPERLYRISNQEYQNEVFRQRVIASIQEDFMISSPEPKRTVPWVSYGDPGYSAYQAALKQSRSEYAQWEQYKKQYVDSELKSRGIEPYYNL